VAKRRLQVVSATQVLMTLVLIGTCMFSTPVLAGALAGTRASASPTARSTGLKANAAVAKKVAASAASSVKLSVSRPKRQAPVPVKPAAPASTARQATYSTSTTSRTTTTKSSGSELATAKAILAKLIAKYPILVGTTVSIGATPGGYQAVTYYKSARILVSPTHTAPLDRIMLHECWHIIDWRDNGVIDWGENVPR
jgi:hypothetical protein